MKRKGKTVGQRRDERDAADRRDWESFQPLLEAVQSLPDALRLASQRRGSYPANLGFFLQSFAPPAGANRAELKEYLRLIGIFDSAGAVNKEALTAIDAALRSALASSNDHWSALEP